MACCVVAGVGPGNGAACARRFARAGYDVALLARSAPQRLAAELPGKARAFACDITHERDVQEAFAAVRREFGPVDVLVQNAGNAVFGDFMDVSADQMEAAWRTNTLGLFLCGREAATDMIERGHGAIIVIGATASVRGGAGFAAFAQAKAAQRSLTQSMARLLAQQGVHVAHVIVDGVIDMPRMRERFPDRPDQFFLKPEAIAETVFALTEQDRSAWTFELDVRPSTEPW